MIVFLVQWVIDAKIATVNWITTNHQDPAVANISQGFSQINEGFEDAIISSVDQGLTWVIAASNEDSDACGYSPGRLGLVRDGIITVAATNPDDGRGRHPDTGWPSNSLGKGSNWGTCVDIFAPGTAIISDSPCSTNDCEFSASGTSAAAPHVTGAVAMYLQYNQNASPSQVWNYMESLSTKGVLSNIGVGSPNKLLYIPPATPPSNCTPPANGDIWVVGNGGCTFTDSAVALGDVIVEGNSVLTISGSAILDIDFTNHKLLIEPGSGVKILPVVRYING